MSGAASEPAKDFRKNKGFVIVFFRAKSEALDNISV